MKQNALDHMVTDLGRFFDVAVHEHTLDAVGFTHRRFLSALPVLSFSTRFVCYKKKKSTTAKTERKWKKKNPQ